MYLLHKNYYLQQLLCNNPYNISIVDVYNGTINCFLMAIILDKFILTLSISSVSMKNITKVGAIMLRAFHSESVNNSK